MTKPLPPSRPMPEFAVIVWQYSSLEQQKFVIPQSLKYQQVKYQILALISVHHY
jgi:hypothetical protein